MNSQTIIKNILKKATEVKSVIFVGCGASKADLYPAKYFLEENTENLRVSLYTANEFNFATPKACNETAIVITASLGGATPETVEATTRARKQGAHVISLTHIENSAITKDAEYVIVHGFEANYAAKQEKMTYALELALEILHQTEGYAHYDALTDSISQLPAFTEEAVKSLEPQANIFAENYKDEKVIYFMSSGATHEVAYATSICLMMEMQWIHSGTFHDGEFFHGPFEIVDKDVPFVLFMNDGKTRTMDSRALTFLNRFDAKTTVLDSCDFGLGNIAAGEVIDYVNPMLLTAVMRVYAEKLAEKRNHPLTKRRYMWKLEY
ncbi:SIS domain-containing protein [Listeria sp. ILCC797]|uniref:SIS domain-containing protein n=1 Tax=Listeria sp. ILCC797 TaxID=1918333 RepID=UPI000B5873FF|nr:SIS domain-containing protein [Listeria sp. ILCC797]